MANTKLQETFIRHQIFLQRYGGSWWNDAKPILIEIEKRILRQLHRDGMSSIATFRLKKLEMQIIKIIELSGLKESTLSQMPELIEYEQAFTARAISGVVSVEYDLLDVQKLIAAVQKKPVRLVIGNKIKKATIDKMYDVLAGSMSRQVSTVVSAGLISGDAPSKITTDVKQIAFGKNRRDVEAVTRTIANHTATQSRLESIGNNKWMFNGLKFIATLDSRTSLICAGYDGQIFPLTTTISTPMHYNCRSTMIPNIRDKYSLDPGGGKRASKFGPVSSKLTYDGFLRKQNKDFQNEVLGIERAKLFRRGMPIKNFTNDNGIVYNLDTLKEKDKLSL